MNGKQKPDDGYGYITIKTRLGERILAEQTIFYLKDLSVVPTSTKALRFTAVNWHLRGENLHEEHHVSKQYNYRKSWERFMRKHPE
jgi:hypothetical protein